MKTSAVKHKVRWYQQTLRKAGVIEHVLGDRGVWRYALKTEKNLHECWNKMALVGFSTDLGVAIFGNAQQVFHRIDEPVTLCVTSPPYLLRHARAYGAGSGRGEQAYIDFILQTLEPIVKQLVTGGSITLNITQDAFNPGRPSRSLYVEKLTLALCENLGLELMDRLIWVNRAKPPSPTHWACKHRVQLAVSYECVLWFTNDAMRVKSDMAALVLVAAPKVMGGFIGDIEGDSQASDAHNRIERFIDADEYTQLIAYLQSSNSKAQPGFLPFDYMVAQAGVKEDKLDVPVIKRVVEGYNTIKPFATVPGPVRYALEMSAFNDVVTDEAKLYQANQLSKSAYLSETGKQGGLTGSGLLLLGASILLWVRQISRRVCFLKTSLTL